MKLIIICLLAVVASSKNLGSSMTWKYEKHIDEFGTSLKIEAKFVTAVDDNGNCQIYKNVKQLWTGLGLHDVAENLNDVTLCYRHDCNEEPEQQQQIDCGEFTRVSGEVAA